MNITVFGLGYVGLTTAVSLAEMGHTVTGIDTDSKKIVLLKKQKAPFFEPGLQELLNKSMVKKRLSFEVSSPLTTQKSLPKSEAVFCAVATPQTPQGTDLQSVLSVARLFAKYAAPQALFVNKSTVPVGTSDQIVALTGAHRFVANPEFLSQGNAVQNTLNPDRIVVGLPGFSSKKSAVKSVAEKAVRAMYAPLLRKKVPFLVTDVRSAELVKYASNAFLATRVSFINEMASICEKTGGNIQDVAKGMGYDPRIGHNFLRPGIGFGGSCLPRDLRVLQNTARKSGVRTPLLKAVENVNKRQPELFLARLKKRLKTLKGKKIAVWGVAFKPNTDDLRAAPSVPLVTHLLQQKAQVYVYDPRAMDRFRELFPANKNRSLHYGANPYDILKDADALLVFTEWEEFWHPNFARVKKLMRQPIILDGRSLYDPALLPAGL